MFQNVRKSHKETSLINLIFIHFPNLKTQKKPFFDIAYK